MAPKPQTAKIIELETSFDAIPVPSSDGEVIWADVRIEYTLAGLVPTVTVRVPVPWNADDTSEGRKAKALRCARQLIDHACRAAGLEAAEPEAGANTVEDALEAITPPAMEGLAQELGLANPTRQPRQRGRKADV